MLLALLTEASGGQRSIDTFRETCRVIPMAQVHIPQGYGQVLHSLTLVGDNEPMALTYGVAFATFPLPDPGDAQIVADACHDAFGDTVMVSLSNQYTLTTTELKYQLDAAPGAPLSIAIATGNRVGGASTTPLPQNCAYLVHKRTALAGRRGRGRLYLPGPPEVDVSAAGALGSAFVAAWQTVLNTWLTDLNGRAEVGSMVLLHSTSTAIPDPADLPAPSDVTALTMDPVIATQRRRLR